MPILSHKYKELLLPEVKEKISEYMDKVCAFPSDIVSYAYADDELLIICRIELSADTILSLGAIIGMCTAIGIQDSKNNNK